ncbi:uncharacterized protein [Phaseolus vulgaris]|uniref:uncharacterized protein n=1 Tax=Phaseolus vulgaris TaxID=3885 RepID=UPI0035CA14D2
MVSLQMRVLFDYHELWDVVESGVSALAANATEAQRVAHRDQKKKDNKALYLIHHQEMNDETFEQIEGATTSNEHVVAAIEEANDISKMTVRLYKHKPQLVAPIINMVAILAKVVVVARIMETLGAGNVVAEDETKGDHHAVNCAQEDSNHEQDEEDQAVLMTTTSNETPNNQTWYLDTGCTNHMCGKELFADLDDSFRTKVKFGDGMFVPVTGKGRILITFKNGDHRYIYDVFYIPDMKIQPEAVIQPEVATMMERPRRQQRRQPVYLQDCEVNLDDEVDDNGNLVHFAFLAESDPMRLADVIQHPKWQKAMNDELMVIEKNNIMTQIRKVV